MQEFNNLHKSIKWLPGELLKCKPNMNIVVHEKTNQP